MRASLLLSCVSLLCLASAAVVLAADPISPDQWCIEWGTDEKGANPVLVQITRSWAPLGSDRLYALMNANFFSQEPAAFFRVVPSFVVQFGISGVPELNNLWGNATIADDPVLQSNLNGTLTFATAGPNTRTTQLFINTQDNPGLDSQGFAPLGKVVQSLGTIVNVFNPTPNDSDGVDQGLYAQNGYQWIETNYPGINSITASKILPEPICPQGE